jgi:hypothetical protein
MLAAMLALSTVLGGCVSNDGLESASTTNASTNIGEPVDNLQQNPDTLTDIMTVTDADVAGVPTKRPEPNAAQPVSQSQALQSAQPSQSETVMAALPSDSQTKASLATGETTGEPVDTTLSDAVVPMVQGPSKTWLINGLLSAVPFIGYGFRNLSKKMPEAKLYSYMGVVEGPAVIGPTIIKEAEAAYRADPTTSINLIGISLGADLITVIADKLADKGVPVNYLGIVDGTHLQPIRSNVRKADNLTCSNLDCTRAKVKLARGNTATHLETRVYASSHIPLGNNEELHSRVMAQVGDL